jgi:DNA polymerase-1
MDAAADHDARGEDIHAATATEVLGVEHDTVDPAARSKAKMVNYGIAYGRDWLAAK